MGPSAIYYLFLFQSYGLSKVNYCMVDVRFGTLTFSLIMELKWAPLVLKWAHLVLK